MPAPTPLPLRRALWHRARQGESVATIAQALGLPPRTVRRLRLRALQQPAHPPSPNYAPCGRRPNPATDALRAQLLDLRRNHPTWGAGLLHVLLQRQQPTQLLPSPRTFRRWLHAAGFGPAPAGRRRAGAALPRADQPHQVWQIDASEGIRLRSGQLVSWLRLVDECTGAVLQTKVFAQGRWLRVPALQVQAELRRAFTRWGRPGTIRVDNGGPWGSAGDLPPELSLWLLGLGMEMHWNDPHQPTQNAVVERSQRTGKAWAEAGQCDSPEQLQDRLQEMDAVQREAYPWREGQSRAAAYPQLAHSGRVYSAAWERQHWELERVLQHLAGYAVRRKVDKNGDVSLYHRPHYVGIRSAGQDVYVMVDPERVEWVFADERNQQLRVQPAEELTAERIRSLNVSKRR